MNEVEQYTWNVIREAMLTIDPERNGWFIDVGIGDQDFYFEWAHNYGYRAIAVEPLPTPGVIDSCQGRGVPLFEGVLTDHNGTARLHRNSWINSLTPQLWDNMEYVRDVPALSYPQLVERYGLERVTVLKLDVEGAEWDIIQELGEPLPEIVSFEFGGVLEKRERRGAWAVEAENRTANCLQYLGEWEYETGVKIEAGTRGLILKPFTAYDILEFDETAVWGNIIMTRQPMDNLLELAHRELRFAP